MARKEQAAAQAVPAAVDQTEQEATSLETGASQVDGAEPLAGDSIHEVEGFTKIVDAEIKKAKFAGDYARAGTLEMLHVRAGEFLTHLRTAEGTTEGEVLDAVQRLKALL